jgi:hypothetical protein
MAREPAASLRSADYAALHLLRWLPKGWPAREVRVVPGRSAVLNADVARRACRGRGVDPALSGKVLDTLLDLAVPASERTWFADRAREEANKWNASVADYAVHVAAPDAIMRLYAECWVLETALRLAAHDAARGRARAGAAWFSFRTWLELALAHTGSPYNGSLLGDVEQTAVDRWARAGAIPTWQSLAKLTGTLLDEGYPRERCVRRAQVAPELVVGAMLTRWARSKSALPLKLMFEQMFDRFNAHRSMLDDHAFFHLPRTELCSRIVRMGIRDPALYTMVHERLIVDRELSPEIRRACAGLTLSPHEYLLERQLGRHNVQWSPRLIEANDLVFRACCAPAIEREECWRKALAVCEEELDNERASSWLVYALAYALQVVLGESPHQEWRNQVLRLRGVETWKHRRGVHMGDSGELGNAHRGPCSAPRVLLMRSTVDLTRLRWGRESFVSARIYGS